MVLGLRIEEPLGGIPISVAVRRAGEVCFLKHAFQGHVGSHRQHREERRSLTSLGTKFGDRKPSV